MLEFLENQYPIQSCPVCASLYWKPRLLCNFCHRRWRAGLSSSSHLVRPGFPWTVYSTSVWRYRWQRAVYHGLKGGGFFDFHLSAAEHLAAQLSVGGFAVPKRACIVVAPPRISGQLDHAGAWGLALSAVFDLEIEFCLSRSGEEPQKTLSAWERAKKKLSISQGVSPPKRGPIIFADDVVTTGGTAKAAWIALGQPPNFQVWTIGCRPKAPLV